jgi:hypothetical protein
MKKTTKRAPASKGTTAVATREKVGLPEKVSRGITAVSTVDPQALLMRAIDKDLPIESMERLLALRDKMKAEWAREQYFTALSGFQKDCPVIEKGHDVLNKDKRSVRYRYAALEDLSEGAAPFLEKWGFSWTCKPEQVDGKVKATVHAHHKDGHEEVTSFEVPLDPDSYMTNPQRAAAALTFATRYAFKTAFGIQTRGEDNDAQDDDPPRRAPVREPQERGARVVSEAVPVQHEPALSEYEKGLKYLKATETDPKSKAVVGLFTENEQIDYTHNLKEAKDKPEELAVVIKDIIDLGKKRRAAVKGTEA